MYNKMFSITKPSDTYVLSEIIKEQEKNKNNSRPPMAKDILNIPYIDNDNDDEKPNKSNPHILINYK
tara:strand:+ start:70 stop:270 length:201 start_codon:yes stop_codon:yes gene_type:complete